MKKTRSKKSRDTVPLNHLCSEWREGDYGAFLMAGSPVTTVLYKKMAARCRSNVGGVEMRYTRQPGVRAP
jgi:hypothetical protein